MSKIYEIKVNDGTRQYFDNKTEADFYAEQTRKAGLGIRSSEFDVPETARDFARFMNNHEAQFRKLRLAALELSE